MRPSTYHSASYVLATCMILLSGPTVTAQNKWERKADLPEVHVNAVSFSFGDYGYLGTGISSGNGNLVYRYDPQNDKWERYSVMPGPPRDEAFCFPFKDRIIIGGGLNTLGANDNELWEFDPVENTWNRRNDLPFHFHNRYLAIGFSINDKGYLKRPEIDDYGSLVEYDPITDEWTRRADFPGIGVFQQVGFSLLGKGYVGLGFGDRQLTSEWWEYDPALNRWERKANFPGYQRYDAVSFTIGRRGYVGSGLNWDYGPILNDFWEYSPDTDSWSRIADCPFQTLYSSTFSINGKGYYATGLGEYETWEYTPRINSVPTVENPTLIHLYPNPAHDHVYVKSSWPKLDELKVYSITGTFVGSLAVKDNRIDLRSLESGLYYFVDDSGAISAGKMLVIF
ncbi:MAG: kelch repeat-containing protein [Bacteroidales bacterium]|nr:kelch repeat-containing protein [Bacteroidales bacterium]